VTPTPEQDRALVKIARWAKSSGDWLFSLAGYAGTGKTTLVQHFINTCGRKVLCCAPTGKAASVLGKRLKGVEVKTVHQLLYRPCGQNLKKLNELEGQLAALEVSDPDRRRIESAIAEEKQRLSQDRVHFEIKPEKAVNETSLVIVDEASMVSEQMLQDFEKTGAKVLFVGDGGQLPPVRSVSWFLSRRHDAELNTVMRQALESPIVRLSMEIRNGSYNRKDYAEGDCIFINKMNVEPETWLKADQIITGGNNSRRRINRFVRKRKGIVQPQGLPVAGEKMICLKNDYRTIPAQINGVQFATTAEAYESATGGWALDYEYEGVKLEGIEFYPWHCQLHYEDNLPEEPHSAREGLFECDYAYAITCHKSQGSEWDSVIVADDLMQVNNANFRKRWLYTAVTRAKSKLMIVV
jgi:exodeoxyribonuclease-5